MTIPTTGAISMADIQNEFGGSSPISMNEYYAYGDSTNNLNGVYSGTQGRPNGSRVNIPSTGAIDMNSFHGTVKYYGAYLSDVASGMGTTSWSSTPYSHTISGLGINQLHIYAWGAGGAGAQWPNGAPGGYGGDFVKVSFIRGQSTAIDDLLDSITSLSGGVGDRGSYQMGRLPDYSRSGGAGGTSDVYINGSTLICRAKGGHGSRATFTNNDSNYAHPSNSGVISEAGGTPGASVTYAGGGGGQDRNYTSGGTSTYGGWGGTYGVRVAQTPGGGGYGYDNGWEQSVAGAPGEIRFYINRPAPF